MTPSLELGRAQTAADIADPISKPDPRRRRLLVRSQRHHRRTRPPDRHHQGLQATPSRPKAGHHQRTPTTWGDPCSSRWNTGSAPPKVLPPGTPSAHASLNPCSGTSRPTPGHRRVPASRTPRRAQRMVAHLHHENNILKLYQASRRRASPDPHQPTDPHPDPGAPTESLGG